MSEITAELIAVLRDGLHTNDIFDCAEHNRHQCEIFGALLSLAERGLSVDAAAERAAELRGFEDAITFVSILSVRHPPQVTEEMRAEFARRRAEAAA